uniref:Putative secreted protein n=1 Tax=Anopheles marajoara TaxID=58244 RepID=A0A2M4CAD4_9DIPT
MARIVHQFMVLLLLRALPVHYILDLVLCRVTVLAQSLHARQRHTVVLAQRIVLPASNDTPNVVAHPQLVRCPLLAEPNHRFEKLDLAL